MADEIPRKMFFFSAVFYRIIDDKIPRKMIFRGILSFCERRERTKWANVVSGMVENLYR
jgi:hypothetical protein